jgi:hypothetical protein
MQQDAALALTLVAERHHDWIASTGAKTRVWEELCRSARRRSDPIDVEPIDIDPESAVFVVFTSGRRAARRASRCRIGRLRT